jgi:transcriptional regulator with XRE-family HTH domain
MTYSWITQRRHDLGISQEELATRLYNKGIDVTRATVSHWEKGRYRPPFDNPAFTEALADALDMDVRTILNRLGYKFSDGNNPADKAAAIVDAMPPERQKTALILLEQLLKES